MKTQALLTVTAAALVAATAFGADIHIKSAEDLIKFSDDVNKGTNYKGTTVFLDNDIDFNETTSSKFTPIGTEVGSIISLIDDVKPFRGTFDGQGYTINNLTIKVNSRHAGLFGYSTGLTVKNVVMGASCFIENTYEKYDDSAFFGGIIGECEAKEGDCIIEDSVNMADVLFSGKTESGGWDRFSIGGGVYGRFASQSSFDAIMRNCANYGTITQTGTSPTTYIGGLRGGCHGSESHKCIVENCLNTGSVIFNGTTKDLFIGGLGGKVYLNEISNSASIGMITTNQSTTHQGALVGGIEEGTTTITNCVWTEDTGMKSGYGATLDGGEASPDAFSNASSALNSETLAVLNKDGNKWILNSGRHTVQFFVNGALTMSANTALVQQPDMSGSGGSSFNGWYTDASCTCEYTTYETTGDLDLYGTYGVLQTITFILNDTVQVQSQQKVLEGITYPDELFNKGHTFIGWNNTGTTKMPDYDITFTAQWAINNYTVTFDFDNGTSVDQTLLYNNEIVFPEDLMKRGHTFNGWNNTDNITEMPDYDITFTAQWSANSYSITFDFGNGTSVAETLHYNEEIVFPEDITRPDYTFIGWNTTENITTVPDYDITFRAQWIKGNLSNLVEIVFNKKGITEEEARRIIESFSDYDFTIESFGTDDDSNAFIIIKFEDPEQAKSFIETIEAGSGMQVKSVNFIGTVPGSFSPMITPLFSALLALIF